MTGVLLMAGSFLVYPAYPILVLWPVTDRARVEVTLVAAALSWARVQRRALPGGPARVGVAPAPRGKAARRGARRRRPPATP